MRALDKTLDATSKRNMPYSITGITILEGLTHQQFALQQYGKAIKRMKRTSCCWHSWLQKISDSLPPNIVFWGFNGDTQSAVTQIRNVLQIIKEWRQRKEAGPSNLGNTSETSFVDSTELIRAFNRLDNASIMIMDAKPIDFSQPLSLTTTQQDIPEFFTEARLFFEFILSELLHRIANAYAWLSRQEAGIRSKEHLCIAPKHNKQQSKSISQLFMEEREQYIQKLL